MKNILNKLVVLLLAGFALAACTEHTEYDDTGFSSAIRICRNCFIGCQRFVELRLCLDKIKAENRGVSIRRI